MLNTHFIVPNNAHYYKIIEILKQFRIITFASACFGSRSNHHQGAVLCLAKNTNSFISARRYRSSQCHGGISARCAGARFTVGAGTVSTVNSAPTQQADMQP